MTRFSQTEAGRAYVEAMLKDPSFQEKWEDARGKLREWWAEHGPSLNLAVRQQQERLTNAGFPAEGDWDPDDWLGRLIHIGEIIEKDLTNLNCDEIEAWAMAWLDREKLRAKITEEQKSVIKSTTPEFFKAIKTANQFQIDLSASETASDDFRSVNWYGEVFAFTIIQAACIKQLWEHREKGTPDLG